MNGVDPAGREASVVSRYAKSGSPDSPSGAAAASTQRDRLVLAGLKDGMTAREIAQGIGIDRSRVYRRREKIERIRSSGGGA